jgi:antitoxin component of MazEF toxin-antitoxin module
MESAIRKWGNSSAVRLPKSALRLANLREEDNVQITARPGEIVIRKAGRAHRPLADKLKGFQGACADGEYDASSVGEERFW